MKVKVTKFTHDYVDSLPVYTLTKDDENFLQVTGTDGQLKYRWGEANFDEDTREEEPINWGGWEYCFEPEEGQTVEEAMEATYDLYY